MLIAVSSFGECLRRVLLTAPAEATLTAAQQGDLIPECR